MNSKNMIIMCVISCLVSSIAVPIPSSDDDFQMNKAMLKNIYQHIENDTNNEIILKELIDLYHNIGIHCCFVITEYQAVNILDECKVLAEKKELTFNKFLSIIDNNTTKYEELSDISSSEEDTSDVKYALRTQFRELTIGTEWQFYLSILNDKNNIVSVKDFIDFSNDFIIRHGCVITYSSAENSLKECRDLVEKKELTFDKFLKIIDKYTTIDNKLYERFGSEEENKEETTTVKYHMKLYVMLKEFYQRIENDRNNEIIPADLINLCDDIVILHHSEITENGAVKSLTECKDLVEKKEFTYLKFVNILDNNIFNDIKVIFKYEETSWGVVFNYYIKKHKNMSKKTFRELLENLTCNNVSDEQLDKYMLICGADINEHINYDGYLANIESIIEDIV